MECLGSTKFVTDIEEKHGRHDIPEAKAGRDLHQLVDEVVSEKANVEQLAGEGTEDVVRCLAFIERYGYGGGETEVPLELKEGGELVVRCRIDYLAEMDGAVIVVDWKFYHDPLDKNEAEQQMLISICAAAFDRGVNKGYAKLYLPILDLTYEYEVQDVLEAYRKEILPAWKNLNESKDLTAGPWCARCPVLGRCPGAANTMQTIAASANLSKIWEPKELPTIKVMEESFYEGLQTCSPAKFRGMLEWLPVVPAFEKAVKRLLREQLEADATSHPGWVLQSKNLPATCEHPEDLEERVVTEMSLLTTKEFAACSKLSISQVKEKIINGLVERGEFETKKSAIVAAEQVIGPHVTRKTTTELRRKKL